MKRTKWWVATSVVSAVSVVGYQRLMTKFDEKRLDTTKGLVNDFYLKSGIGQEQVEGVSNNLMDEMPSNTYVASSIFLVLIIFGISLFLLSIRRKKLKQVRL